IRDRNVTGVQTCALPICYLSLVFPFVIMTFGVFFMRQVIMAIPDELLEAARIDGANEFWIYVRVVLALSKSGLMALGVFAFSERSEERRVGKEGRWGGGG